jgi:hypothetical protein
MVMYNNQNNISIYKRYKRAACTDGAHPVHAGVALIYMLYAAVVSLYVYDSPSAPDHDALLTFIGSL